MVVGVEVDGLHKLAASLKRRMSIAFDALLLLGLREFDARRRRALLRGEEARLEALLRVRDLLDDGQVIIIASSSSSELLSELSRSCVTSSMTTASSSEASSLTTVASAMT